MLICWLGAHRALPFCRKSGEERTQVQLPVGGNLMHRCIEMHRMAMEVHAVPFADVCLQQFRTQEHEVRSAGDDDCLVLECPVPLGRFPNQ